MENFAAKSATDVGMFLREKGVPDAVCEKFDGEWY